ncbi:pre-peptidase C-terminal domain-containing protein [candidate division CSSED10-310 bacterium]|uniref:Pre-peptidase C-terminal domain-containing protein n=1 Tax=candidate division CSSED10-310 bacterium TaxID=2855610 RepID=A0ABV6Z3B2_UNCC1
MKKIHFLMLIIVLSAWLLTGCTDDSEDEVTINSFTASASNVLANDAVTLTWDVTGATSLSISPDVGDVTGQTSVAAYPLSDTTYTLTAANSDQTKTATVEITTDLAGYAYLSNPITATGDGTLKDENDQTNAALDGARSQVQLKYLDGSGSLIGTYADLSAPGIYGAEPPEDYTPGSVVTDTDSYHFSRDTYAFSEVNCYYHITATHDLLTQMGFSDIINYAIPIHAFYEEDLNAFYSGYDRGLHFGYHYYYQDYYYIGPDSSEDSEVVVHEYGHAIQADQYYNWGSLNVQGAMGEGFSDFLGQLSAGDTRFLYYEGEWFAHLFPSYVSPEGIPYLRPLNTDRTFPDDLGIIYINDPDRGTGIRYQVHYDGIFWSSALMALHDALVAVSSDKKLKTLELVIQSHYDKPKTFREAGTAILAANTALYEDIDKDTINAILTQRGMFAEPAPPSSYPVSTVTPNSTTTLITYAPLCHYAQVTIGEGVSQLQIKTTIDDSNPNADMDLYIRKDSVHFYDYDYYAATEAGNETVTLDNPAAGTYGICIHSYSKFGYYGTGFVTYYLTIETS